MPDSRRLYRWIFGCCCLWCGITSVVTVHADEALRHYFDQLRQRGLFSLAEHAAMSRLNDPLLLPQRRTDLVIELAKTLGDHAQVVAPPQQPELWKQADDILLAEITRSPQEAPLLELQRTFLLTSQAQLLTWELRLAPHDTGLHDRWLQTINVALAALDKQGQRFEESLRNPRREARSDLALFEQRQLLSAVRQEQGCLLRDRAAQLPDGQPQRASDLVDAATLLRQSLSGMFDAETIARSKLALADCARLEHDYERSREMCVAILLSETDLQPALRDAVTACRIRTWLDAQQPLTAAEELLKLRQSQHVLSGELWFIQLQTLIALRDIADQKQDREVSQTLTAEAEVVLTRVAEQAGGRWLRYCQQLWTRTTAIQTLGMDLERVMQLAQSQVRTGQLPAAAQTYATAIELAETRRLPEVAIDLRYSRGTLLLDVQEFAEAVGEFNAIVNQAPTHEKAASASLLAAYAHGRIYDSERTQSHRENYTQALQHHLEQYAQDSTADDARCMLAQLEEQRLQLSKALPLYLAVNTQHPQAIAASLGALRCYEGLIQRLQQLQRDWQPLLHQARQELTRRVETWDHAPSDWTPEQAEIVLGLSRLALNSQPADYATAARWLEALTVCVQTHAQNQAQNTAAWKPISDRLLSLRLIALAGTGQSVAAKQLLSSTTGQDAQTWLAIILGLEPLPESEKTPHQVDLQELLRATIRRLEPLRKELTAEQQTAFDLVRVKTLLVTGEDATAVQIAEQLATQHAKTASLQISLGKALTQSRDRQAQALAVTIWRRVESLESSGSVGWLTARAEVIESLAKSEQFAEAQKLLKVTRLLYPQIEDPLLNKRYQDFTNLPQLTGSN